MINTRGSVDVASVTYDRARDLCQQADETERLFPVLFGLFMYYAMRAEHKTAREIAEQAFRVAQQAQDPDLLPEAYYAQGNTLTWIGEFASARTYLEQGIAFYDPQKHGTHAFRYGHDPGVGCRAHSAQVS
jgi:tetratricopeptide (TPR) repeat protein